MSNYKISKKEALNDYLRRIETSIDLLEAAQTSAKQNDIDIVDLYFVLTKLHEYTFRLEKNIEKLS